MSHFNSQLTEKSIVRMTNGVPTKIFNVSTTDLYISQMVQNGEFLSGSGSGVWTQETDMIIITISYVIRTV